MTTSVIPPIFLKQQEESARLGAEPVPPETPAEVPKEPPAASVPAPAMTFKEVATEEMTAEQRYKVLEGMHKAEAREARRAKEEKAALEAEIAALKAAPAVIPPAPLPIDPAMKTRLEEQFGEQNLQDLLSLVRTSVVPDIESVKGELGNIAKLSKQSSLETFEGRLDDLVPEWRKINLDPKFVEYMNEEEGNTGMSRLGFANKHMAEHNAPRLARYFAEFAPSDTPAAKVDKKKLTAPPATPARERTPREPDEVPPVRLSEIKQFAEDVKLGKYRDKPAEIAALQAKIDAAMRANRIERT